MLIMNLLFTQFIACRTLWLINYILRIRYNLAGFLKASELNCSLLIEDSQNASFLILASDKPENHSKKGKGAGITKIEGSGRKKGGEEKRQWSHS